jgi:RNA recognition motif-containing protein
VNIYIGNLSFDMTEEQLRQAFEAHGEVSSVSIITDKYTGDSRGFAFVEMSDSAQAKAAISALDGQEIEGRTLKVSEARPPRENREGGRGGGGRRNW